MHTPEDIFFHDHGDGIIHCHEVKPNEDLEEHEAHEHPHHAHTHVHENSKAVINRLAKAIGHLESVKRMVETGRDCTDVLIQLAAVRSALNSTAKVILKDHFEHCINDNEADAADQLKALNDAIDKFMS